MKIVLDAKTVTGLIDGDPPHLRARMDQAQADGASFYMSSLVLHELAYAAMVSEKAARRLAQLDAFIAHVEVAPWTSEDALTAARIRADHEKQHAGKFRLGESELLCAAQALNNGWTVASQTRPLPAAMRSLVASFGAPLAGLSTIDWSSPSGD